MAEAQFDLVENYDTAPESDWFHSCRESGKPYVVVRTSEKTADVMWDYVTLPPGCDGILMANERLIKEQAIAIFQKHASVESSVRAKARIVFFDNLSIPKAKLAANELYDLIESIVENPAQSTDKSPRRGKDLGEYSGVALNEKSARRRTRNQLGNGVGGFELIAMG
jgi:hypothetical protein